MNPLRNTRPYHAAGGTTRETPTIKVDGYFVHVPFSSEVARQAADPLDRCYLQQSRYGPGEP